MSVLVAAPLKDGDPFWQRWISCFEKLTYPQKEACIASESAEARAYVREHWPYVRVLSSNPWRPLFTKERVYAITEARETIRRYVCEDPRISWLLFIDIDVNFPPDTIERTLALASQGFDLVFSRTPGLLSLIHRDLCQSVTFCTGVNLRNQSSYLEEHYQVERQIEVYNSVRPRQPFFRVWAFDALWLQHKDKPIGTY